MPHCEVRYPHLALLELADSSDGRSPIGIDVLLGSDHYWDLLTGEVRRDTEGPVAISTKLGWVLTGPAPVGAEARQSTSLMTTHSLKIDAQPLTKRTLEDPCVHSGSWSHWASPLQNGSVLDEFGETIQFKEGRYKVFLP